MRPFVKTGVVMAAMVLGLTAWSAAKNQASPEDLVGKPAPTFNIPLLVGKTLNLAAEKGNVVVLDFWATWCPPCRESLPHLQKLSEDKALANKGLKVYATNLQEKREEVSNFVKKNNYTFPVAMDLSGAVARQYLIRAIPTQVVIGRDGKVAAAFVGFGPDSAQRLHQAVEKALAASKPAD